MRLAGTVDAKLILVSAPAGFGKTTLITESLGSVADSGAAVAWLSLDERDNDPVVFWSYVLATLVNELHAVENDLALVLDDFHVIEPVDAGVPAGRTRVAGPLACGPYPSRCCAWARKVAVQVW